MRTKFNRFAIFPFHCTDCHNYIWMEPYRFADVDTGLAIPAFIKKKICKRCLKKYNIKD